MNLNKLRLVGATVIPALLVCGCSNLSHTENGALAGGGLGALTGAVIGHATGHTAGGAAIGAGVGALAGGLTGHAIEQSEHKAEAAAVAQSQMGMNDVIQMAQNHISDDVIIQQIQSRGVIFHLSAQDTIWLKQNGVSDRVVEAMLATANGYPRRFYSTAPVYAQPVYVVEPAPAPPVVGVGLGYSTGRWR